MACAAVVVARDLKTPGYELPGYDGTNPECQPSFRRMPESRGLDPGFRRGDDFPQSPAPSPEPALSERHCARGPKGPGSLQR